MHLLGVKAHVSPSSYMRIEYSTTTTCNGTCVEHYHVRCMLNLDHA